MKLTISRDALHAALDRVGRVVERRNTIPILSNLKAEARMPDPAGATGTLRLTGTDLDMEVISSVEADVAAPGETTFPAETIAAFVRKLPAGGKVEVSAETGQRVTLKSGRSRVTVNALAPGDFPDLSAGDLPNTFELGASRLATMLDRVSFAISSEETRYYLNGIYLHPAQTPDGIMLRAVATDGHRLARHQIAAPAGAEGMAGIILPRKAVAEIGKVLKVLGEESVRIAVSATKLRLIAGVTTLTTKLIDGTFPDYDRVIPAGNDKVARLETAALAGAVERVGTISSERGRAVKFAFSRDGLVLTVTNPDTGDATDEVETAYDAEPIEIGFNGRYVEDMMAAVPGAQVTLAMADPGSPCLITPEGDDASLFVLMPMRV